MQCIGQWGSSKCCSPSMRATWPSTASSSSSRFEAASSAYSARSSLLAASLHQPNAVDLFDFYLTIRYKQGNRVLTLTIGYIQERQQYGDVWLDALNDTHVQKYCCFCYFCWCCCKMLIANKMKKVSFCFSLLRNCLWKTFLCQSKDDDDFDGEYFRKNFKFINKPDFHSHVVHLSVF